MEKLTDAVDLLNTVQEISLAQDREAVTGIVKRAARRLSGADGVTFVLRDGDHCYYVDEDAISPLWKGHRFPMESCISGWAMMHRETVVIEDIYEDDRIPHDAYRPTFVKSLAMVPVRSADPIAAIGAYWAVPHKATPREVELLQWLANTTAVAIDNLQLIQALERRAEDNARHLAQLKDEIARREAAEQQFFESQKMEAIGRLAGGVAHDFNNLLMIISGYACMAIERAGHDNELLEALQLIVETSDRAATLTRQLLAFSRRQTVKPEILDLNAIVTDMEGILKRLFGASVGIEIKQGFELGHIEFDRGQIEQVIMNLAVNAKDAMPKGGVLALETSAVVLGDEHRAVFPDAQAGPHVMLSITDTGVGMSEEVRQKVFEPFFTTKPRGEGTGLGLSAVYGLIKQCGGNISLNSEPGRGTTFKIYFPCAEREGSVADRTLAQRTSVAPGTGTILLVEDDDALRKLLCKVLERGGYQVIATADGAEALRTCEEQGSGIHLLLTDVVLPEMDGAELAARILGNHPQMRVVFMSGYTEKAIVHQSILQPGTILIEKPIAPEMLLTKVGEVLS